MSGVGQVWIVETGDYEQRHVAGIYVSLEAAVDGIKETYKPPYRVAWYEVEHGEDCSTLTGDFEAVLHYSIEHTAYFDIRPMELQG